jgi:hypothetical protein
MRAALGPAGQSPSSGAFALKGGRLWPRIQRRRSCELRVERTDADHYIEAGDSAAALDLFEAIRDANRLLRADIDEDDDSEEQWEEFLESHPELSEEDDDAR